MLDTWTNVAENPARHLRSGSFAGHSCDSIVATPTADAYAEFRKRRC